MYTAVLMLAMTSGAESVDFGRRGCCSSYAGCSGCYGYCSGCSMRYYASCSGCYGGYPVGYHISGYAAGTYYAFGPDYYPYPVAQMAPLTETRKSFYPAPGQAAATIRVLVPDAEVWFDTTMTKQRGRERVFQSPPLESSGTYTVKARWLENGRQVEQERRVQVQPGQAVAVAFDRNAGEKLNAPAASKELPK